MNDYFNMCFALSIVLTAVFTTYSGAVPVEQNILLDGVRIEQITDAGGKQGRPGVRVELGILSEKIDVQDKAVGAIVVRDDCKSCRSAIGDPDHCTVAVYVRFCRVVSNNPYIEQCYWMVSQHVQGTWNEKNKCCEVTVDGRKLCAKGPIYQQF